MCPDVSGLRVNPHYALEALRRRERRAVAEVEEVIVLQPLGQRLEVGYLPLGQLVPDCDRELLGLFRGSRSNNF